jgi:hypothetical protein
MTLGLALVSGFVAQVGGLAMIVGGFSAGIALSRSRLRADLKHQVTAVHHVIVPVFFVVVGMLVDVRELVPVIGAGLVLTTLAVAGKLLGCGGAALGLGFHPVGALRVGVGMVPRGEVALLIAGIGLGSGVIGQSVFAVVIFMTFATTVLAPVLLVPAFRVGGAGFGRPVLAIEGVETVIDLPAGLVEHYEAHLLRAFHDRGFQVAGEWAGPDDSVGRDLIRGDDIVSVRTLPGSGGHRRVEIASEAKPLDWELILATAGEQASAEAVATFDGLARTDRSVPPRKLPTGEEGRVQP